MNEVADFYGKPFKLLIGSDHGGFSTKQMLLDHLRAQGVDVEDVGPRSLDPEDDYPDFACLVAAAISRGAADCGILICRSGIGMSINANRFPFIRAAVGMNEDLARMSREHNCSNILVTGGDKMSPEEILSVVDVWLATPFTFADRHLRRLQKIDQNSYDEIAALRFVDPEIAACIDDEQRRQSENLILIASENIASPAVRAATGSCLTNKYAEGYPGRRYYGGCEYVDEAERLALERVLDLFGAEAANVQPHSGSQANMAVYFALLEPGDTVLAMDLSQGGHLTHGLQHNFSGRLYNFVSYGVDRQTEMIDYDQIAALAAQHRPKLVLAGASAYPRTIDFPRLRAIADDVVALLMVDMAHIAGLVAAGAHPNPVPYCDVVTSTTHKTLRGPRGGLILCRREHAKKINSQVFPGIQGGPLMHVIAAKAVCFREAASQQFKDYQQQVLRNAEALSEELASLGFRIVSGGTDNHLMLVDLRPMKTTGLAAQTALDAAGLTTNRNLIPYDPESPHVTSGLRLGTPTLTTQGMGEPEMRQVAEWIHRVIIDIDGEATASAVRAEVHELSRRFPFASI